MEKIDLTKCRGLHFKASIDGSECTGKIQVEDGCVYLCQDRKNGTACKNKLGYPYSWCIMVGDSIDKNVTDFEIVPRDPETYRDWQVGDLIGNADGSSGMIIFRSGEFVVADIDGCRCRTCRELFDEGYCLMLTDIEQKIIEGKKKYEPQDGDIVAWKDDDDDGDSAVSIYKAKHRSYMTLFITGSCYAPKETLAMGIVRPATDEEKQKLFDAMSKEGKRWNAEKKVVEDIPKPYKFKKGEPVLVRDNGCVWKIGVFTKMRSDYFQYGAMTNGLDECGYHYCIPYNERTMHLLGTSEDYKEE